MTKSNGKPCKKCGTSDWYKDGHCKKCDLDRGRKRNQENPDRMRDINRQWRQNNRDRFSELNRRWRKANHDKVVNSSRQWRKANPEKRRESQYKWVQANQDKVNAIKNRRRTRKTEAGGSYTAAEWQSLCDYYGNKCLRCGRDDVKLTADHIKPVSKGGHSNIDNIQPLCLSCNSAKKDRHIDYRPDAGPLRWLQCKLFG